MSPYDRVVSMSRNRTDPGGLRRCLEVPWKPGACCGLVPEPRERSHDLGVSGMVSWSPTISGGKRPRVHCIHVGRVRILFDQGVPVPLRTLLKSVEVRTAWECRWHELSNGDLIRAADNEHFDVLVTTDQNLRYQQNLSNRRIAIVVLRSTSWPRIRCVGDSLSQQILAARAGMYVEIDIP